MSTPEDRKAGQEGRGTPQGCGSRPVSKPAATFSSAEPAEPCSSLARRRAPRRPTTSPSGSGRPILPSTLDGSAPCRDRSPSPGSSAGPATRNRLDRSGMLQRHRGLGTRRPRRGAGLARSQSGLAGRRARRRAGALCPAPPKPPSPAPLAVALTQPISSDLRRARRIAADGLGITHEDSSMSERKKLADILLNSDRERLDRASGNRPKPADDLKPIAERRVSLPDRQRRTLQRQERDARLQAQARRARRRACRPASSGMMSGSAKPPCRWQSAILASSASRAWSNLSDPFPKASSSTPRLHSEGTTTGRNSTGSLGSMSSASSPPSPSRSHLSPSHANGSTADAAGFDWRTGQQKGVPKS